MATDLAQLLAGPGRIVAPEAETAAAAARFTDRVRRGGNRTPGPADFPALYRAGGRFVLPQEPGSAELGPARQAAERAATASAAAAGWRDAALTELAALDAVDRARRDLVAAAIAGGMLPARAEWLAEVAEEAGERAAPAASPARERSAERRAARAADRAWSELGEDGGAARVDRHRAAVQGAAEAGRRTTGAALALAQERGAAAGQPEAQGSSLPPEALGSLAQLRRGLARVARRINPRADLAFVFDLYGEGEALLASGSTSADRQRIAGMYERGRQLATISLDITRFDPRDTVAHELFHSLEGLLPPADQAALRRDYPGTGELSPAARADWNQRNGFPPDAVLTHEERVAYAFGRWSAGRERGSRESATAFGRLGRGLWQFGGWLAGRPGHHPEAVFEAIAAGAAARQRPVERTGVVVPRAAPLESGGDQRSEDESGTTSGRGEPSGGNLLPGHRTPDGVQGTSPLRGPSAELSAARRSPEPARIPGTPWRHAGVDGVTALPLPALDAAWSRGEPAGRRAALAAAAAPRPAQTATASALDGWSGRVPVVRARAGRAGLELRVERGAAALARAVAAERGMTAGLPAAHGERAAPHGSSAPGTPSSAGPAPWTEPAASPVVLVAAAASDLRLLQRLAPGLDTPGLDTARDGQSAREPLPPRHRPVAFLPAAPLPAPAGAVTPPAAPEIPAPMAPEILAVGAPDLYPGALTERRARQLVAGLPDQALAALRERTVAAAAAAAATGDRDRADTAANGAELIQRVIAARARTERAADPVADLVARLAQERVLAVPAGFSVPERRRLAEQVAALPDGTVLQVLGATAARLRDIAPSAMGPSAVGRDALVAGEQLVRSIAESRRLVAAPRQAGRPGAGREL